MPTSVRADAPQTAVAAATAVVANAAISGRLVRRGVRRSSVLAQFAAMAIANAVIAAALRVILTLAGGELDMVLALFWLLLLTLLVTLYDRDHPVYLARTCTTLEA